MLLLLLSAVIASALADTRVEFQLVGYINPGSVLADGITTCASKAPCDLRLTGYVDTEVTALDAWPGPKDVSQFTAIFQRDATDQSDTGKIVSRDICGDNNFKESNLRVEAVNMGSTNSEIQQFQCLTSNNPQDVASSVRSATWSIPEPCDRTFTNPSNAKLTFQWRAFNVNSDECTQVNSQ